MSLMMAMEIAEQRRAEAKLHREHGCSRPASEEDLNLNRAAVNWFPRLRRHGVHPHYLKQHSNETVAIISDLIIWKAKDAKFADADNPWRQVLAIYARRKINKPGKKGRHGGSVPGLPTPDRHNTGSGDYRFDEMVPAAWGVSMPVQGLIQTDFAERASVPVASVAAAAMDSFDGIEAGELGPEGVTEPQIRLTNAGVNFGEYALPAHIDDEGASRLRSAATPLVDGGDFDESLFELKWAMNDKVDTLSDEQAIALVSGKLTPRGCTPFMYFIEGARLGGRMAGVSAYREATIRRTMLMIAIEPSFADARRRLGLE